MTWSEMRPLLEQACWDTLYMVGWSTLIALAGGLPIGVLLVLTERGGLAQNSPANKLIGQIVNVTRSMPFIILMVALMSFTRWVTGTSIGREAAIVPLAIGAIPFFARLVETSVREVDGGLVEAVQSMGGSTWTVVRKVLIPEALPSLVAGATTTVVALIGYSAMAGTVGAGGLGDLAVRYGYQRFETELMWIIVAVLAVVISAIQFAGDVTARALHRRRRSSGTAPRLRLLRTAVPAPRPAAPTTPAAPSAPTKTSGNEPRQQPATGSDSREKDIPRA
ncbi:ABC transporter permease [Streptomyces sp. WAC 06738]|uniref:methionine ABC transporter permease n=1 Tax=Streptomyces sp. WAC 06738 TaxID=2203210 RepID=UPI000F6D7AF3|nr:methionine ABC transporter permease [Streptomyces sp. WAC 06738]AZM46627.1 ABC transporter permease [Streptomyces sp. WAC 06738]